jgi:O-acetyl-ADP-ribose deacetylase
VIHAAVMGQDLRTSGPLIERATRNSLAQAETLRLGSIAFPAFGTGVGGFPIDECARTMLAAIRAHLAAATSLRLIRIILFGLPAYRVFAEVAGEMFGTPLDGPPDCPLST